MITLAKYGLLDGNSVADEVRAYAGELLDAQTKDLTTIIDDAVAKFTTLRGSNQLTRIGIEENIRQFGNAAIDAINKLGQARRRKLDSDLAKAKDGLPSTVPDWKEIASGPNGLATLQRLQEIRGYLLQMNDLEQLTAAQQAAEVGDQETLLAFTTAPLVCGLMSGDELNSAVSRFLELRNPDVYSTVNTIESAIITFDSNIKSAKLNLSDAAGIHLGRE